MPYVSQYDNLRILKRQRRIRKPKWQTQPPRNKQAAETYAIAARFQPRFARTFLEAVKDVLPDRMPSDFKTAYEQGSDTGAISALPLFNQGDGELNETQLKFQKKMEGAYAVVVETSGSVTMQDTNKEFGTELGFSIVNKAIDNLDDVEDILEDIPPVTARTAAAEAGLGIVVPINPYSKKWMRERSLELVEEGISKQQREVVQQTLIEGFEAGRRAETVYSEIKSNIGLTGRDARAVKRRTQYLKDNLFPKPQVERLTNKYRNALLGRRAELISRTETIQAQARGRADAWRIAEESGDLPKVERMWISAPPSPNPNSPCDICLDLDGKTAPVNGQYESLEGPIDGPTAHPGCVCSETLQRAGKPSKGFNIADRPSIKQPPTKPAFKLPKPPKG
jgi:hypothetical protein